MEAAFDCIEYVSDDSRLDDFLSLPRNGDWTERLRFFQFISAHYASLAQPLWSNSFADLHLALLNLLLQVLATNTCPGVSSLNYF